MSVGLIAVAVIAGFFAMTAVVALANALLPETVRERIPAALAYLAWGGTTLVVLVLGWMWLPDSPISAALRRREHSQAPGEGSEVDGGLDPGRIRAVPATHLAQHAAVADHGQQDDQRPDAGQVVQGEESEPGRPVSAPSAVRRSHHKAPVGKGDVLDHPQRHDPRQKRRKASDRVILAEPAQEDGTDVR